MRFTDSSTPLCLCDFLVISNVYFYCLSVLNSCRKHFLRRIKNSTTQPPTGPLIRTFNRSKIFIYDCSQNDQQFFRIQSLHPSFSNSKIRSWSVFTTINFMKVILNLLESFHQWPYLETDNCILYPNNTNFPPSIMRNSQSRMKEKAIVSKFLSFTVDEKLGFRYLYDILGLYL